MRKIQHGVAEFSISLAFGRADFFQELVDENRPTNEVCFNHPREV